MQLAPNHLLFHHVAVGAAPSLHVAFETIKALLALDASVDAVSVEPILVSHLKFSVAQAQL